MHAGLHHAERHRKEGDATPFDHAMIVVGLVGPLALIPQVLTIWVDRGVAGLSLLTWALLTAVSFMWILYGVFRRSKALVVANILYTIFNFLVVLGVFLYR